MPVQGRISFNFNGKAREIKLTFTGLLQSILKTKLKQFLRNPFFISQWQETKHQKKVSTHPDK